MTKSFTTIKNFERKHFSNLSEIKRHRKYMASQKWKASESYQSIKDISDESVEFRQNYNKCIGIILRTIKVGIDKRWSFVKKEIFEKTLPLGNSREYVEKKIKDFVLDDIEVINGVPHILRHNNYLKLSKTGNCFYIDSKGILREPATVKNVTKLSISEKDWFVLKSDDNVWYKVTLIEDPKKYNIKKNSWIRNHFSGSELKGKKMTATSSLSKKDKRHLKRLLS